MKFSLFAVFVFSFEVSLVLSSRILVLNPTISKSHVIVMQGLTTTLAEQGHEITMISPFPLGKKMKNYRDIKSPFSEEATNFSEDLVKTPNQSMLTKFPKMLKMFENVGKDLLEMPEYRRILNEEKFDLVIIGGFMNNFLLGVGGNFKCPTIMMSMAGPMTFTNSLFGNPLEVSAVPHVMLFKSGKLNFLDRVKNFVAVGGDLAMQYYTNRLQRKIYDEYFPADKYISYDEALKNISMVLLNSHFTQGSVRPYVPAMIEVGGITVKPKPDPLPADIQNFLDGAKDGAIFFSFGSNAKTTFLQKEKIEILLKVFSSLKQRIIMKWESDLMEGKPENLFIGKWLPQDDILAHKNVKLFISHCGLGSTAESKYHGVPVLAIPLFADQSANADVVVNEGWGVKLDLATMTEKTLRDGLNEVLENPKFRTTVEKISELYRDRPMNARETATFWVEYVIRHRGAPHLQYPGVHLNFWQSTSLDIIGFLIFAIYVGIKIFIISLQYVWMKACKPKSKTTKKKKNN